MIFWTRFVKKWYFWLKIEKVNWIIKLNRFEFVTVPNFSKNWQFWVFEPNLPSEYDIYIFWYTPNQLHKQQNKCCNQKSKNFENITFLPKIYNRVTKNLKTSVNVSGGKNAIPRSFTTVNIKIVLSVVLSTLFPHF